MLRITGAGKGEVWYETGQSHVVSLAFDAQGRCVRLDDTVVPPSLTAQLRDGFVSIGLGSVFVPRDSVSTNSFDFSRAADVVETPRGNFTNTIFRVNGLTGRSKRFFWGTQP